MNVFRLVGDLSHLLAIVLLLIKIWKSRSCAGKSNFVRDSGENIPSNHCKHDAGKGFGHAGTMADPTGECHITKTIRDLEIYCVML